MIKYLEDEGVGVTILSSEDDIVFPPEQVIVDDRHNVISMKGDHMEITKNPEEYMKKIDELWSQDEIAKSEI